MQTTVKKPIYDVLTEATVYPYTPPSEISGISIVNDGIDDVTVVINDGTRNITINCTTNGRTYNGDFRAIKTINATAGTTFQIELRSVL